MTIALGAVGSVPTIARGVAPDWLAAALAGGAVLLVVGAALEYDRWRRDSVWPIGEQPAPREQRQAAGRAATRRRRTRASPRERAVDAAASKRRREPAPQRGAARRGVTAGGAALTPAILTGSGRRARAT